MKKFAVLLTIALVVTSIVVTGCGRAGPNTDFLPRAVPHAIGVPFENCNVCHIGDQLSVGNIPHADFTNDSCAQAGCHGERTLVRPNPAPSPISRPIPHAVISPLDNCVACHLPAGTGNIIPHSMYVDNSTCLTPACHSTGTAPPVVTTSPPPTGNPGTTTTTPPDPPGGAPLLDKAALPLPLDASHSAAMATMCIFCHNADPGPTQYPIAPSWAGSVKSPGPWTVTAGTDADHTDRMDNAACVAAGCHAKTW